MKFLKTALATIVAIAGLASQVEARYAKGPVNTNTSTGCITPQGPITRMSPGEFQRNAETLSGGSVFGSEQEVYDTTVFGKSFSYGIGELGKGNYRKAQSLFKMAVEAAKPQRTFKSGGYTVMTSAGSRMAAMMAHDAAEAGVRVWLTMNGKPGTKVAANDCVRVNLGSALMNQLR
jgi:hypothetical protein